jgi:hypothetical protein
MNTMKIGLVMLGLLLVIGVGYAQDVATLLEEAKRLEQKFKDDEALTKYKQAALIEPQNLKVQAKLAEANCSLGSRQTDPSAKAGYFAQAKLNAEAAIRIGPDDAEANCTMATVLGKLTEVETNRETLVKYVKEIKEYADKALAAKPDMGRAWHVLGKWHLEVLSLNAVKKAAIKVLYGGLPPANVDAAIVSLEKAKALEPYYCLAHLDLAKAYEMKRLYEKAIANLELLAKLPTRRQDDVVVKAEGAALLQKLQ